ncbi:hypothetical protein [Paramagnetospirillum kuznetsovii]|nr:hypothetical protein [Paramagnetospirillum kuznetsovii]
MKIPNAEEINRRQPDRDAQVNPHAAHRPKYRLAGLPRCSCCGGTANR